MGAPAGAAAAVLSAGQRPQVVLLLQVDALAGSAASAGGSARGAALAGSAIPPGGRPYGGICPREQRRCLAVPHPAGEATAGASARGLPALQDASLL